jgi:hypothetical protein
MSLKAKATRVNEKNETHFIRSKVTVYEPKTAVPKVIKSGVAAPRTYDIRKDVYRSEDYLQSKSGVAVWTS